MERCIVWIDSTNRTHAVSLENGGASIPQHPRNKPTSGGDELANWFAAGWRVESVGGVLVGRDHRGLPTETLGTVLEHD